MFLKIWNLDGPPSNPLQARASPIGFHKIDQNMRKISD